MAAIAGLDGIDPADARTLRRSGISTTEALLRKTATLEDRKQLDSVVAVGEQKLLSWALNIDLMRIKGIGVLYCRLLNQVGVFSIEDLRVWDPHTLEAILVQVNGRLGLSKRLPNLERVTAWVLEAQSTEPMVRR